MLGGGTGNLLDGRCLHCEAPGGRQADTDGPRVVERAEPLHGSAPFFFFETKIVKLANRLPTSLKTMFFKKICETGAMPLFHACGAARVNCAFRRPRRPVGGRPAAPPVPSPPSFFFFLSLSLFLSFSLFFLLVRIVGSVRYETIPNRTAGGTGSANLVS